MRIIVAFVLLFSTSFSAFAQSVEPLSGETQNLTASDGSFSFDVPIEWHTQNFLDNYFISPMDNSLLELVTKEPTDDTLIIGLIRLNSSNMFNGIELTVEMSFDEALQTFIDDYNENNIEDDEWTLVNPTMTTDKFDNPRAIIDIIDEKGIAGRVYFRTYGDNQYLVVIVSARSEMLAAHMETIEAIEESINFENNEQAFELELRLLWQTPVKTDLLNSQVATSDDSIYVTNLFEPIQIFDYEGTIIGDLDIGMDYSPTDVAIDTNGNLWIADWSSDSILHVTQDGEFLSSIDVMSPISGAGPGFVGLDTKNNIYTAAYDSIPGAYRVKVYEPDGKQINDFPIVEEFQWVVPIEMFDDTIYVNILREDIQGFATDGTSVNNLLLFMVSQMTDRQVFVPIGNNQFVMTIPSWQNPGTMALFLFDGGGNILGMFNINESITGFRFMENILPDPQLGFLDFASLGINKFVMLSTGASEGDGELYAFEIVINRE